MSNVKMENVVNAFSRFGKTRFCTFAQPYLDFIGKGKVFGIIYLIMAVFNLIIPFAVVFMVSKTPIFQYGDGKVVLAFILCWLIIVFACWIGFQLWVNRKSRLKSLETSEFVVTPMFSDLIQTLGEWLGTMIGITGAGAGLIASIMLGSDSQALFSRIPVINFLPGGFWAVIAGPIAGLLLIIVSRFVAEQFRILSALANNTKDIANNLKKDDYYGQHG